MQIVFVLISASHCLREFLALFYYTITVAGPMAGAGGARAPLTQVGYCRSRRSRAGSDMEIITRWCLWRTAPLRLERSKQYGIFEKD